MARLARRLVIAAGFALALGAGPAGLADPRARAVSPASARHPASTAPAKTSPAPGGAPAPPGAAPAAATQATPGASRWQRERPNGWLEQITDALRHNDLVGAIMRLGTPAIHGLAAGAALVLTWLCFQPIWAFLRRGWMIKRDDVMSSLDDEAKRMYLARFQNLSTDRPAEEFDRLYRFRYGRYRLYMPLSCLLLIVFPLSFILCETALGHLIIASPGGWRGLAGQPHFANLLAYPPAAAAAVAGAYTWTVAAFINGATRYTMPPSIVAIGALRLAVAAPLGYAVAALLGPHGRAYAPVVAFGLGAFPLDTIQLLLRRLFTRLGLDLGPADDKGQVTKLDGVDKLVADRMSDADISTVAQLAYCDPVQVSMKTNIAFDVVMDMQAQALAWIYFGDAMPSMRPMGLRGAIEFVNLRTALGSEATRTDALATLAAVADKLELPPLVVERALDEVADDHYTQFLANIWATARTRTGVPREPDRNVWLVVWRQMRIVILRAPRQSPAPG